MSFQIELEGNDKVHLDVTIEKKIVSKAYDSFVNEVRGKVNIPGFRPNRVPRTILLGHIGKKRVSAEIQQQLVEDSLKEACEKENLIPVTAPEFKFDDAPADGKDFTFKATLNIVPLLKEIKHDGYSFEIPSYQPQEEDTEKVLSDLAERQSKLEDEPEGTEITNGHYAKVDIEAFDGDEKVDSLSIKDSSVHIPDHSDKDESESESESESDEDKMENLIMGKKVGDAFSYTKKLAENYANEDLSGKEIVYRVAITGLSRRNTPEINDDFAKSIETEKCETLDELKEKISKNLITYWENNAKQKAQSKLLEQIAADNDIKVHQSLIDRELDYRISLLDNQLKSQGASLQVYLDSRNINYVDFRKQYQGDMGEEILSEIKADIVVDTIARLQDLECKEEDLKARFKQLSEETGKSVLKLRAQYEAQRKLEGLEKTIVREKVFNILFEKNDIKYKQLSREEYEKLNAEEGADPVEEEAGEE